MTWLKFVHMLDTRAVPQPGKNQIERMVYVLKGFARRNRFWDRPTAQKKGIGTGRAQLVVLGIEIGGRWSEEGVTFIRILANHKASSNPLSLRRSAALAWTSRWTALLATAAMRSFACSLPMLPASASTNVDGPPPSSVMFWLTRWGWGLPFQTHQHPPVTPSRRLAGDCPALKTVSTSGNWPV